MRLLASRKPGGFTANTAHFLRHGGHKMQLLASCKSHGFTAYKAIYASWNVENATTRKSYTRGFIDCVMDGVNWTNRNS